MTRIKKMMSFWCAQDIQNSQALLQWCVDVSWHFVLYRTKGHSWIYRRKNVAFFIAKKACVCVFFFRGAVFLQNAIFWKKMRSWWLLHKILPKKHGIEKGIVGILISGQDHSWKLIRPCKHRDTKNRCEFGFRSPESKWEIQRWRFLSRSPGKLQLPCDFEDSGFLNSSSFRNGKYIKKSLATLI